MSAFIPPWAHDGGTAKLVERLRDPAAAAADPAARCSSPTGRWDNEWQEIPGPSAVLIGVVQNPALRQYQGKTLARGRGAAAHGCDRRAVRPAGRGPGLHLRGGVRDVGAGRRARRSGSPGCRSTTTRRARRPDGLLGEEHPHPRAYGTFPRILRKYVREERRLTLEDAIRKFTSLPAQRMRLADRGVLKVGMWADVVVFDPATRSATARRSPSPNQLAEGMRWVLVNGVPVIADGRATGALPGRVIGGRGGGGAERAAAAGSGRRAGGRRVRCGWRSLEGQALSFGAPRGIYSRARSRGDPSLRSG